MIHCPIHGVALTSTVTEQNLCAVCQHVSLKSLAQATKVVRELFDNGTIHNALSTRRKTPELELQRMQIHSAFAKLGAALENAKENINA
jgi:hypothetical protein